MKRIELFEFEDFNWLPKVIRTGATNLLVVFHKMMGTTEIVSQLIQETKNKQDFSQIVDLGSGSGGIMPDVFVKLKKSSKDQQLKLLLSDLHPNPSLIEKIKQRDIQGLDYNSTSVNASKINEAPNGLKTMIASFHHMNPTVAKSILQSAEGSGEPILIYEVAKNNIPLLLWWLFLPVSLIILVIMALVMTPFVRPLSVSQILFTYLIPIIPIIYAWDGQASLVRTYTFDDIENLLKDNSKESYKWQINDALNSKGKKVGYYILGYSTI